ncbi:histidine phosphatase family protein [Lederbergia sp. NSJ-179]|nr:histidine phosphatase family protein [Lederbergia sp. NSJ-179]
MAKKQEENSGGNVLIITNGMTIGAFLSMVDSSNRARELDNASETKIEYAAGQYTVKSVGDMSYVEKGRQN